MRRFDVEAVCTTDDPTDSLTFHKQHRDNVVSGASKTLLLPTWRPDKAFSVNDVAGWNVWTNRLGVSVNNDIDKLDDFRAALKKRHDFFHEVGCRLSDHGLETAYAEDYTEQELQKIFDKARAGEFADTHRGR